jgi:hypothetical protein
MPAAADAPPQSNLLYELASARDANLRLAIDLAAKTEQARTAAEDVAACRQQVAELELVRESNNEDLTQCERKACVARRLLRPPRSY